MNLKSENFLTFETEGSMFSVYMAIRLFFFSQWSHSLLMLGFYSLILFCNFIVCPK